MPEGPAPHGAIGPSVAVCTPSYRRRALLLEMMDALDELVFPSGVAPRVQFILVDNSPDFELADLGAKLKDLVRWPARLEHEPKPGLTAVRNRLLALAGEAGVEFIAFIDDDERPAPDWLDRLLKRQRETQADIVTGAVRGVLPDDAPRWMRAGRFFDNDPQPSYRGISGAHTATVLVRTEAIDRAGATFEHAFGLTGGEDTMFFTRLEIAGAKAVEAPDAVVEETVPAARARFAWLWRRWARTGSSEARLELVLRPGLATRLYLLAGGLARMLFGVVGAAAMTPLAVLGPTEAAVTPLKTAARGLGFVRGAFGRDIVEYSRG